MRIFRDNEGREWSISVTVAEAEAIEDATGLDIGKIDDLEKMFAGRKLFLQAFEVLVREQLATRNLGFDSLKRALSGDPLEAAAAAVQQAVLDFFPSRIRPVVAALESRASLIRSRQEQQLTELTSKIEAGEMDSYLRGPSNSATGSPPSPESPTPGL